MEQTQLSRVQYNNMITDEVLQRQPDPSVLTETERNALIATEALGLHVLTSARIKRITAIRNALGWLHQPVEIAKNKLCEFLDKQSEKSQPWIMTVEEKELFDVLSQECELKMDRPSRKDFVSFLVDKYPLLSMKIIHSLSSYDV